LATIAAPEVLAYDPTPETTGQPPAPEAVLAGLHPDADYGVWPIEFETVDLIKSQNIFLEAASFQEGHESARETATGTCGRCTRCLDECPTAAFVGPYHLDPLRCISYWTIETQGPVPVELRPLFGNRIFGCDICQEVCPWNRRLAARKPRLAGLHALEGRIAPPLLEGFHPDDPYWLDDDAFRRRFRRSPIRRAKRHGMLRNVCIALGNWADPAAVAALGLALNDSEPLARGHAAWALGCILRRHALDEARSLLVEALAAETDPWARSEIEAALVDH
jgi:epoxyqueuosine reductase